PICIHRAPLGTHERFIGFLIEHYAGNFPLWLSPKQVIVLPISDKYNDYAKEVCAVLLQADIRAHIDERSEKIGRKIRDAETQKIPIMLIIGEKESTENKVSVREHGKGDQGSVLLDDFVKNTRELIEAQTA
ncbi:MAG: threonine--tRNA ligase, partial [Saprospiraceae bacterium]|nr:threonine--tRNA ligase [Saprospiraceae bacterium]